MANQVWTSRKKIDIIKGYSVPMELKQKLFAFLDIQLEFVLPVPHFKFVSSRLNLAGSVFWDNKTNITNIALRIVTNITLRIVTNITLRIVTNIALRIVANIYYIKNSCKHYIENSYKYYIKNSCKHYIKNSYKYYIENSYKHYIENSYKKSKTSYKLLTFSIL